MPASNPVWSKLRHDCLAEGRLLQFGIELDRTVILRVLYGGTRASWLFALPSLASACSCASGGFPGRICLPSITILVPKGGLMTEPLDWKFQQAFGDKPHTEEVTEGSNKQFGAFTT